MGIGTSSSGEHLTLLEYQNKAALADRRPDSSLAFPLLGLFGETGSLLSVVKKKQRDAISYLGYTPHVIEELGDVLWYLSTIATRGGVPLADIGANLNRDFSNWIDRADPGLTFAQLQEMPAVLQLEPTPKFERTLLDLAGEVGTVLSDYQADRLTNNQATLKGRLIAALRTLIRAADEAGVTLEQAAIGNLHKIFDRWPLEKIYPVPFDEKNEIPKHERLPRALCIEILEREVGGRLYVFQQCNGINVGDRLTDNAIEPDDYRFHDVFHYAHCAVLTWSPVTRALLRLKRKSSAELDEAQDGARAILIEEGITTWMFGQAKLLKYLEGIEAGDLSFDILKTVRQFVAGYEPAQSPLWLWEEAILQGYAAFRFLQRERRARLRIDMLERKLIVETLAGDA